MKISHFSRLLSFSDEICDMSTMNTDARTDLERSFYFFIKATNSVLAAKSNLPPHVLFALDNAIRRVTEHLVAMIRPGSFRNGIFFSKTFFFLLFQRFYRGDEQHVDSRNERQRVTQSDQRSTVDFWTC